MLVNFLAWIILRLNWEPSQVPIKKFGAFIPIAILIPDDYKQAIEHLKLKSFDPAYCRIDPPILYESDDRVIVWDGTHRIFGLYYDFLKK